MILDNRFQTHRAHLSRKFSCCVLLQIPCIGTLFYASFSVLQRVESLGITDMAASLETLAWLGIAVGAVTASRWLDRHALATDALLYPVNLQAPSVQPED